MLRQLLLVAIGVTVLASVPQNLFAQSSPSRPAAGQRVRLHFANRAVAMEGMVIGWSADTLVLGPLHPVRSLDTVAKISRASIVSYRVGLGPDRGRGFERGAKTGALIGGTMGLTLLLIGVMADQRGDCGECIFPASLIAGVLGAGVAVGGTLLGAALGALSAPERWSDELTVASGDRRSRSGQLALVFSLAR